MDAYMIFIDNSENGIDDETLEEFEKQLGDGKADNLYLIIKSGGGSPFSSVAMMNILDSRFTKISTIIPEYAKSAATLMALGTDKIYMSEKSALGPLDLPTEHHRDGSRISALDIKNTITTMASLIESIAENRFDFLRKRSIPKKESAQFSLENATDFLKPIVSQIDPYHLQKAHRELRIGQWYAIDMLSRRMMKGKPNQVRKTTNALVNSFPAHEYSIFSNDAKEMLHLTIEDLNKLDIWNKELKVIYNGFRKKSFHIQYGIIKNDATNLQTTKKGNKK